MKSKLTVVVGVAILGLSLGTQVFADQYIFNRRKVCRRAAEVLAHSEYAIAFCSECEGERAEIWQIKKALVTETSERGYWSVNVLRRRLFHTRKPLYSHAFDEPVIWDSTSQSDEQLTLEEIDLAYVYVPTSKPGRYRCLALELKLSPLHFKSEFVELPADVQKKLSVSINPPALRTNQPATFSRPPI